MAERFRTPKSPHSFELHAGAFKRVDVKVFSRMYGRTDKQAAQDLIDLGGGDFNGHYIRWTEIGDGISRAQAAEKRFVEFLGEATHRPRERMKKNLKKQKHPRTPRK